MYNESSQSNRTSPYQKLDSLIVKFGPEAKGLFMISERGTADKENRKICSIKEDDENIDE